MVLAHDVTRRTLLRGAALGTIALASGMEKLSGQGVSKPPNIVFMMADDMGYADVSCYGRPDLSTPNVDRMAAEGVRFLQAYANSAVCTATRTALITGRYQYRLPIGLEEPLGGRDVGMPPGIPTLPSLLKKWATARRSSASGTWAGCRDSAHYRAVTTISTGSVVAPWTTSGMIPIRKTICGTTMCRSTRWVI